ncbi:MAG: hypothetical protein OXC95_01105 [Dehalococcoidia bacterium]|nr:hypothetical protein [Dehalococcoidia bacterium]
MTTINTADDLLELLDSNPVFLDAVRNKILTDELLALPAVFSSFTTETRTKLNTLEADTGILKGIALETRLADKGLAQIARTFSLRRVRIVRLAEHNRASERFNEAIWAALDNGIIDDGEYERLLDTDLIVQGTVSGSHVAFCAGEASFAADADDIDKVSKSASILHKVFPEAETYAAMYCMAVAEDIKTLAERQGVILLMGRLS